jgi:hypothetical protein
VGERERIFCIEVFSVLKDLEIEKFALSLYLSSSAVY